MRKTTTMLLCSLLWLSATIAFAGENIMKVHDATGLSGENITIELEILNDDPFVAFEVHFDLPEGFGYVPGSASLNPGRKADHIVQAAIHGGTGKLIVVAFSLTNSFFTGSSGVIATFSLTTPELTGMYPFIPKNGIIAIPDGTNILTGYINGVITLTSEIQTLPGDSNCDEEVNVMDVITTINYILGNNPQPFCFLEADVNSDGSVNAIDVIGTINIVLSGGFLCGVSTLADIDGNIYNTVLIGSQCWMKENLRTTHYRNGTPIEYPGTDNTAWANDTIGAYAWYDNDIGWKVLYGALYNWHSVNNTNGLCPTGWHVPSDAEWNTLVLHIDPDADPNALGSQSEIAGGKMKSTRTTPDPHPRWQSPNVGATNESGFTGFPAGRRSVDGSFLSFGSRCILWSSTEFSLTASWSRTLLLFTGAVNRYESNKFYGFGVRCLRDNVRTEVD